MSQETTMPSHKTENLFDQLDRQKLADLLESGSGMKLTEDYFGYARPSYICIAEGAEAYKGVIIVEDIDDDVRYLDKIVVGRQHQGNGIGRHLWYILLRDAEKLVWRARPDNPISRFYEDQCDGKQKADAWMIYWKGLTPRELAKGIGYALAKKPTLVEHDAPAGIK
ncbi:GNAT family N-acetyltransferase [Candidatus Woesearchaeota archaeon]|nr:GNAT family N-acetyltransferase [Candidatus Woesearchaeota archaeon]